MILAMSWEIIDGGGAYLSSDMMASCKVAVAAVPHDDPDTKRLCEIVLRALDWSASGKEQNEELNQEAIWVHKRYVREYFIVKARSFETHWFKH